VVMRQGKRPQRHRSREGQAQRAQAVVARRSRGVTTYDRSDLIDRAISTVTDKLVEEIIVVSLIILLFLWHVPSPSCHPDDPISVVLAFIPMYLMGLNANLMSLAGIAISIGVLVDGAIVEVENAYNKIYLWTVNGKKATFITCVWTRSWKLGRRCSSRCWLSPSRSCRFSPWLTKRPAVQAAGLLEESGHGHCGAVGDYAGSGDAYAVRSHRAISLQAAASRLAGQPDFVGKYYSEERHPVSHLLHRIYEGLVALSSATPRRL